MVHFSKETRVLPIQFSLRGPYQLHSLELEIEFPFPLFSLEISVNTDLKILVAPLPAPAGFGFKDISVKSLELEGEIQKIKTYTPGDPLKLISWKHYAKFQELMVKEFDRTCLEETNYVIQYGMENEKRVFSQALRHLQEKMENLEPFTIRPAFVGEDRSEGMRPVQPTGARERARKIGRAHV